MAECAGICRGFAAIDEILPEAALDAILAVL
jgi:hypothetical protein